MAAQSGPIHSATPARILIGADVREICINIVDIAVAIGKFSALADALPAIGVIGGIVPRAILSFALGGDFVGIPVVINAVA